MEENPEETERRYADIIHRERPEDPAFFRRHPRMPVSERAKIFAPFSALRHEGQLEQEVTKLTRRERVLLSEERIAELSDQLAALTPGTRIRVSRFLADGDTPELGHYVEQEGCVSDVDPLRQQLLLDDGDAIAFDDLEEIRFE